MSVRRQTEKTGQRRRGHGAGLHHRGTRAGVAAHDVGHRPGTEAVELDDGQVLAVLRSEAKKRAEALEQSSYLIDRIVEQA